MLCVLYAAARQMIFNFPWFKDHKVRFEASFHLFFLKKIGQKHECGMNVI